MTVSDPQSRVLQIQGPASPAIMAAASGGAINATMGYFHAGYFDLGGQRLYVSRTGWTGEMGYEVYTQGAETDCPRLWDHLMAAGAPHGMLFSSLGSMETRRIEAGILDSGTDFDRTMTPYQAGLGALVDLDKPGFIGREALGRADRGKVLYGLTCTSATPGYRADLFDGAGEKVGAVTAGAWSPYLNCGIGYARMGSPGSWAGKRLQLAGTDGQRHDCMIVDLPFYDPEKRIPRGLERVDWTAAGGDS
ncbi:MAG: aminomethyltransferase family protein [Rhodobacteraceae bacterium]|nr:aminomethyltransferase family protein [Paracoccaceae bacterium]